MNARKASIFLIVTLALAGCNIPRPTSSAPASPTQAFAITVIPIQGSTELPASPLPTQEPIPTVSSPTTAPDPTAAPSPQPAPTTSAVPTDAVFTPFSATANVDALKLRTGPGTLFPARLQLAQGAVLTVLGRSAGDEWAYVRTSDGKQGWVFVQLIKTDKDLQRAPAVEPGDVQILRGKVTDASGNPVNGIGFALVQGTGAAAPRSDAITDAEGVFTMFLPATTTGTWTLSYTSIACTSRLMDAGCNCLGGACGTINPETVQVTLPQTTPVLFNWE